MGLRYRKSKNLRPFRINLSKSGIGWSFGTKGARYTQKANGGTRSTFSIPGTGISHVSEHGKKSSTTRSTPNYSNSPKEPQKDWREKLQELSKKFSNQTKPMQILIAAGLIVVFSSCCCCFPLGWLTGDSEQEIKSAETESYPDWVDRSMSDSSVESEAESTPETTTAPTTTTTAPTTTTTKTTTKTTIKTTTTAEKEITVYWTPNGKSYHSSPDCSTLSRSKTIKSGTLKQAIAAGKKDQCDKCW